MEHRRLSLAPVASTGVLSLSSPWLLHREESMRGRLHALWRRRREVASWQSRRISTLTFRTPSRVAGSGGHHSQGSARRGAG